MVIFPLRTNRRLGHRPYVNVAIIVANFAIFILTMKQVALINNLGTRGYDFDRIVEAAPLYRYYLHPDNLQWFEFFTYQFIHADWLHVGFNMLFLYVFGNSVEDRMGPLGYLCFYLAAGVVAGIGHCLTLGGPVLGASGAVAGVTGGYLALFPLTYVTLGYWFFILGTFEVSSMILIVFTFFQDVFFHLLGFGQVAYMAHISGNLFGFTVCLTLLAVKVFPRDGTDFLTMIDRWRARGRLGALRRQGWSDWQSGMIDRPPGAPQSPPAPERQGWLRRSPPPPPKTVEAPDDRSRRVLQLRAAVLAALAARNHRNAVAVYEDLLRIDPEQTLPRQQQLDIADLAMHAGRFDTAARGYELYRRADPDDEYRNEVDLILGLLYARYLHAPHRARPLLASAAAHHPDPARRQAARDWLAELNA